MKKNHENVQWRTQHGCNIVSIYYCQCPLEPAILGQSINVSTRNSKVLNTPLTQDTKIRIYKDFDPMMHNTKMNGKSASFNNIVGLCPAPAWDHHFLQDGQDQVNMHQIFDADFNCKTFHITINFIFPIVLPSKAYIF